MKFLPTLSIIIITNLSVSVNINTNEDVGTIHVNFICHKVDYESDIMFQIGIDQFNTISCNSHVMFDSLNCRESYNVSVYWKSSLDSSLPVCLLDEMIALTPKWYRATLDIAIIITAHNDSCVYIAN